MYKQFGLSDQVIALSETVERKLKKRYEEFDKVAEYNQYKVIRAMQKNRVSDIHFAPTTGYGYNDLGRDTLEKVYADVFHTESALVRPQITCGTHALSLALISNLRPGDELLSITGKPYDTLDKVIGIRECSGSLKEYGITYRQVELKEKAYFDYDGIAKAIGSTTKMVAIQRSRGYQDRVTLSSEQIGEVIKFVKGINQNIMILVDNCYGEFVQSVEPSDFGADMVVGSLIKNPGGGLAPIGGYIAGTHKCIENAAYRLTAPGIGKEVGASLGVMQSFYQGLFLAPTVVASALKGAVFAAAVYEGLGYSASPHSTAERYDIIQSVTLGSPEAVITFCKGIQSAAPVDSFVDPQPWAMPGYDCDVIMAAGAFIQGSSIELSADAPIKPPYTVYFQGGLTQYHSKLGTLLSLQKLVDARLVNL